MNRDVANPSPAGEQGLFAPTQWTIVLRAKGDSLDALNSLCAIYRAPLVTWLRCRGETLEDAEDRVQGFFEQLLRRDALNRVAPEKGRFRTFLLTAFQNYLHDQFKRANAAKRGGGRPVASLDESTEGGSPLHNPAAANPSPDQAYDRAWAQAMLARALERLEDECGKSGHQSLCRALEPVLFQEQDAPVYAQVAEALKMSEAAVKMAALRIRRRLRALIREEVLATVASQHDLDAELKYLQKLFGHPAT
jgi:RNA polymerase sigma factor (sigma-70 family)